MDDQSTHPSIHQSFVASGRCMDPDAPAGKVGELKLLETEWETHLCACTCAYWRTTFSHAFALGVVLCVLCFVVCV